MITTVLPAGLNGKGAEMYSNNDVLMVLVNGSAHPVVEIQEIREKVLIHLKARPAAMKAILEWVGSEINDQVNRYGQCLWGAFNVSPDLDEEGNLSIPEYVKCSNRGKCSYEGIICKGIQVSETSSLTHKEELIIPFMLWADSIIALMLGLSPFTVTTHIKNIKRKLQVQTKAEIVDWANTNGIELCK